MKTPKKTSKQTAATTTATTTRNWWTIAFDQIFLGCSRQQEDEERLSQTFSLLLLLIISPLFIFFAKIKTINK